MVLTEHHIASLFKGHLFPEPTPGISFTPGKDFPRQDGKHLLLFLGRKLVDLL